MIPLDRYASRYEAKTMRQLVRAIIRKGFYARVFDGEEWATKRTQDYETLIGALATTGEDHITIYFGGERLGIFSIIYNGDDESPIVDYTYNKVFADLVAEAEK